MARSIETVKLASLTPETFWRTYVAKRQPVLIEGHLTDDSWKATEKWTLSYLREKAGDSEVLVEERGTVDESFGKGSTRRMTFSQFLDELESGNQHFYLSAQNVPEHEDVVLPMLVCLKAELDSDGFPELLSQPLKQLSTDIPFRPALLGNLVPQQINLWMGCAERGSSSGLHHDYHDNLYVLLKGSKHFSLFPPSQAEQMYTYGRLKHVHSNGRIVYHGQGQVLADGSDAAEVTLWEKGHERQKTNEQKNDQESTDESELEAILDRADEEQDDYDSSSADSGQSTDSSADRRAKEKPEAKRRKVSKPASKNEDKDIDQPLSFSQVDLQLTEKEQRKRFPKFPGLSSALQCEVSEGQMLYLPAGWFHNVTSTGSNPTHLHLALNYWCYPPDNIQRNTVGKTDTDSFKQPYLSDYWSQVWANRDRE